MPVRRCGLRCPYSLLLEHMLVTGAHHLADRLTLAQRLRHELFALHDRFSGVEHTRDVFLPDKDHGAGVGDGVVAWAHVNVAHTDRFLRRHLDDAPPRSSTPTVPR